MALHNHQGELFSANGFSSSKPPLNSEAALSRDLLKHWQRSIYNYQSELFQNKAIIPKQISLLKNSDEIGVDNFDPLKLSPLPLNFWRWSNCPHSGPAIYLVMDLPEDFDHHVLLYIGETVAAENRWKGEHDCKSYLSAYVEALGATGLKNQLSIRFWTDVPHQTRLRRRLEQRLIQRWLPPFNKETRARWSTPFTADVS